MSEGAVQGSRHLAALCESSVRSRYYKSVMAATISSSQGDASPHTVLLTPDFPPNFGGISRHLWNIYSRGPLKRTIVVAPKVGGCKEFDDTQAYIARRIPRMIGIPGLRTFAYVAWTRREATRVLAEHSNAILHCGHVHAALAAVSLKQRFRVPYVLWAYALEITDKLMEHQFRRAIQQADLVLTISDYTSGLVKSLGAMPERIAKIRPGTDPVRFCPSVSPEPLATRLGLRDRRVILTVGTLGRSLRYKGQDMVIRALPELVRSIPNVLYVIAGPGDDSRYLIDLAERHGVRNHVKVVGGVADADLPSLYACCDVFILCSRAIRTRRHALSEGFGIVLAEASATGKPVIGGLAGGSPDAVRHGKTGLLVDPEDPAAIGTALLRILTDPDLAKEFGQNGREWIVEDLNWDRAYRELVTALDRMPSIAP